MISAVFHLLFYAMPPIVVIIVVCGICMQLSGNNDSGDNDNQ